jgi:hypothetical protein
LVVPIWPTFQNFKTGKNPSLSRDSLNTKNALGVLVGRAMSKIKVEFSGGLELLLGDKTKPTFPVLLPSPTLPMKELLVQLRASVIVERSELFMVEGTV